MQADVDVLVIGAGACGLAAAITASDEGASVAIVEKLDRPGGNSSLSTGSVTAAGSRFQREAGITDSPETMVRDLMAIAGETDDADLVRRLAEVSAETVEWLVDTVGARLTLVTAYKHIGHSVPRLHAPVSRRGQDLVDDLLAAVARREIPLAVGIAVKELIVDAGAVGGAQYFGALGSTGEAILWGEKLGAAFANMPPIRATRRWPIRRAACCPGRRSRKAACWSATTHGGSATRASAIPAMPAACSARAARPSSCSTSASSTSPRRRKSSWSSGLMAE